jgi:hypothetical protein
MSLFLAPASSYPDVVGRPVTAAGLDMSSLGLSRVVAPLLAVSALDSAVVMVRTRRCPWNCH